MTNKQFNRYIELAREFKENEELHEFIALFLIRYSELMVDTDKLDWLIRELSSIEN